MRRMFARIQVLRCAANAARISTSRCERTVLELLKVTRQVAKRELSSKFRVVVAALILWQPSAVVHTPRETKSQKKSKAKATAPFFQRRGLTKLYFS